MLDPHLIDFTTDAWSVSDAWCQSIGSHSPGCANAKVTSQDHPSRAIRDLLLFLFYSGMVQWYFIWFRLTLTINNSNFQAHKKIPNSELDLVFFWLWILILYVCSFHLPFIETTCWYSGPSNMHSESWFRLEMVNTSNDELNVRVNWPGQTSSKVDEASSCN